MAIKDYYADPALFNKKITIWNKYQMKDVGGSPIEKYHPVHKPVMASIEPISGREYWQASQTNNEATIRIRMRYNPYVNAESRIMYEGKTYELTSPPINALENDNYLELMVKRYGKG